MNESIFFNLKINIPELETFSPNPGPLTGIYKTEVIIDERKDFEITLKIFYKEKEYLDYKVIHWLENDENILLPKFGIENIIQPENLIDISFSEYSYKRITSGNTFKKGYNFFTIQLKGIKFTYNNSEKEESEFYLNQQAFKLIENNYRYHAHFPWRGKGYKWKPQNKVKDFIKFNNICFKPEHHFFTSNKNTEAEIIIKKEPKFSVSYSGLTEAEVYSHLKLLCVLYSFYSHQNITYFLARIYTEDKLYIEVKDVENKSVSHEHGLFMWDFFLNPLNLILQVQVPRLISNLDFVTRIIERFNYALETIGETKFMILYNILEQVRNQYILDQKIEQEKAGQIPNLNNVKEEYIFTLSKKQTDKFIKKHLEGISEIISDEYKDQFQKDIQYKLTPIKVFSMTNQFKSFFEFINIQPEDFDLDFLKLKSLRDSIFHGKPVNENFEFLNNINTNKRLPKLVGTIILKYLGIDEISKTRMIDEN